MYIYICTYTCRQLLDKVHLKTICLLTLGLAVGVFEVFFWGLVCGEAWLFVICGWRLQGHGPLKLEVYKVDAIWRLKYFD